MAAMACGRTVRLSLRCVSRMVSCQLGGLELRRLRAYYNTAVLVVEWCLRKIDLVNHCGTRSNIHGTPFVR